MREDSQVCYLRESTAIKQKYYLSFSNAGALHISSNSSSSVSGACSQSPKPASSVQIKSRPERAQTRQATIKKITTSLIYH